MGRRSATDQYRPVDVITLEVMLRKDREFGRSRGGVTTKLHLAVEQGQSAG